MVVAIAPGRQPESGFERNSAACAAAGGRFATTCGAGGLNEHKCRGAPPRIRVEDPAANGRQAVEANLRHKSVLIDFGV
jgi:hypothetical protein